MPDTTAQARPGASPAEKASGLIGRVATNELVQDIAAVSSVVLVLGLFRLSAPSLWVDEAFTARALDLSLAELLDRQYHLLYYLLLHPWVLLAGTSEWALRFPSVIGTVLSCGLLVVLARRFFDRRVALASGVLLAASPFLVKWSQQARGYTLGLALSLLATFLLLRALDRGSLGPWVAYGIAYSIVVVWHPVVGLLLAPAHSVLAAQRRKRLLPHALLAAVVVGALAVPWAAVVAMRSTGEGVAMNWLRFPTTEVAARALLDVSGAAGVGVALAVVGLWMLRRAERTDLALWLGSWALAPFALALLVSVIRPIYLDRYLIVAAPAFALLAAVALARLGSRPRAAAVLGVVVATGAGLALWYSTGSEGGNWRGEDWRSAVAIVLERSDEADAIVVADWSAAPAARYYGARVVDVSTADALWVLRWSETGAELEASERAALGFGEHRLVERQQFGSRVSAQLWRRD
jgi:mannosyltransferase